MVKDIKNIVIRSLILSYKYTSTGSHLVANGVILFFVLDATCHLCSIPVIAIVILCFRVRDSQPSTKESNIGVHRGVTLSG
jgi:hypothetical protein